jgi:hypothetical protein
MKLMTALAGVLVAGLALPASAQVETWYLVQDVKTKKCTMVGGDGVVYKSRVEAENAMKTVRVCTTD